MATKSSTSRAMTGPISPTTPRAATGWALWRERADQPGWALLPLRLFLGLTMLYAAMLKLLDPAYLDPNDPAGVQQQMEFASAHSPIGGLVTFTAQHAALFGLAIAFGELAVGLGVLLGAFTRLAALGGLLLSLSFFLTLSWGTSPYFFGADIVFVFAFTPLLLAGDGGVLSLQARLRRAVRRSMSLAAVASPREPASVSVVVDRRTIVRTGLVAGLVGAAAAAVGILGGALRRNGYTPVAEAAPAPGVSPSAASPAASSSAPASAAASATPRPTAPPAGGTAIGAASAVPVGSSGSFTDPASGKPAIVVQPKSGTFLAYSAVCTHEGCTVGFNGRQFACPCHGATYNAATGDVTGGPARSPLTRIKVVESGGQLYAL